MSEQHCMIGKPRYHRLVLQKSKPKKPESFLRRADPEKKIQKYKEGNHTESVLMALMHPI